MPAFAVADGSGSAGQPTGEATPTGIWANSDPFWTWAGAVWLHVGSSPDGAGYVRSLPLYLIDCPKSCTRPYEPGSVVELAPFPSQGYTFTGWDGSACVGQGATCTFTIGADTIVTALFSKIVVQSPEESGGPVASSLLLLKVVNNTSGTVTGTGDIDCPTACAAKFHSGTSVTLNNSDSCSGMNDPANGGNQGVPPYTFTITSSRTVTATEGC